MEIARFLSRYPPFDSMTGDELARLERRLRIEFFPAGTTILQESGSPADFLYVVRKGSVELVAQGVVVDELLEGECFGHPSLISGLAPGFSVVAKEETLCYLIEPADAEAVLASRRGLVFLAQSLRRRTARLLEGSVHHAGDRSTTKVRDLIRRAPVIVEEDSQVRMAAEVMDRQRVSSVVVRRGEGYGILTDRDLRSSVLAARRDPSVPVSSVMSYPARTIDGEATADEAISLMLEHGIHHLPVIGPGGHLLGLVTDADLMGLALTAPFAIRNAIERADDVASAIEAARRLPETVVALVDESADPVAIGQTVSVTIDALTRRLVRLAIRDLGDPPAPWAWLALGSQARREQGLKTDQDHALVYDPSNGGAGAVEFFSSLAGRVTDGLETAGIARCRGGVMASNPEWRLPMPEWIRRFSSWVRDGELDARVFTAVAFDYRRIDGSLDIEPEFDRLIRHAGTDSFVAKRLARSAVDEKPPIGFPGRLVVGSGGARSRVLDVKRGGITPIVSLARAVAVSSGIVARSTLTRLEMARGIELIDEEIRTGLIEAFRLIWQIRAEHQAEQIRDQVDPDDLVAPDRLGPLTRNALKDAFRIIAHGQSVLARAFDLRPR